VRANTSHGLDLLIRKAVTRDPGQPRPQGTIPYWLHRLHPLAAHCSPSLPSSADVVIIGSGITGYSVARTLLANNSNIRVTVLEARTICSGATGRNGGHLVAYGGANYAELKQSYGQAMATKIVEFTFRSIRQTKAIVEDLGEAAATSEFRTVTRVRTFSDQQSFDEARRSIAEFVCDNPRYSNLYTIINDQQTLREKYNVHGVVGAVIFEAAALWPYRLIMEGWKSLLSRYPANLTLEAQTPVSTISYVPVASLNAPYVLTTTRGEIRAGQVAYCTNGYTGNLIPGVRGGLYPHRGTMTVQDLSADGDLPNRGAERSWSIHQQPVQDENGTEIISSVHYLQQNAKSGYYFFGGGKDDPIQAITGDDTAVPVSGVKYLQAKLSQFLGQKTPLNNKLVSSWTGIMGFTSDENPLVGRLPPSITSREGNGEWIAAGFNGMGMSLCVASGEALAHLMLGKNVSSWLPEAFNVSESRLQNTLNTEKSVEDVKQVYGGKDKRALRLDQCASRL
jgi:glycine/D-amino acid oxidase-like deaminating enzyme